MLVELTGSALDLGANYAEARVWIVWLQVFTVGDLADSMYVDHSVAGHFVTAAEWHGIIENTGELQQGPNGEEVIWSYVPLPPGPTDHPTKTPPEKLVGYNEVLCARGMPVRVRSDRDSRRLLSTPGSRHIMKMREKRYKDMMEKREVQRETKRRKYDQAMQSGDEKKIRKYRRFSKIDANSNGHHDL